VANPIFPVTPFTMTGIASAAAATARQAVRLLRGAGHRRARSSAAAQRPDRVDTLGCSAAGAESACSTHRSIRAAAKGRRAQEGGVLRAR
jgi:hypothetical protein